MRIVYIAGGLLLAVAAGGAGVAALAWQPEIDPTPPPERTTFDPAMIAEGERLAAIGNCLHCHTAPDGRPYAGGYPLETPFGTIYGTNITPDPDTGIGNWSEAAFQRAMSEGVDRSGQHLYPGFPYDHFTLVSQRDNQALYAYLMTREPVRAETPPNELPWPLRFRPLLAGWKLLFLDDERFRPDPDRSDEWNRGAYLVEGLAHCGACHTPRNFLGARQSGRPLAGGESEGWHAPALNDASTAPVPWSEESLFAYLREGLSTNHAQAAGPMAPVVRNLSLAPDSDIQAMAHYIADRMGAAEEAEAAPAAEQVRNASPPGQERAATLYAGACATCHEAGGPLRFQTQISLERATSLALPDPRNAIQVILHGIDTPTLEAEPLMPGFANALSDEQVADLTAYLRARFTDLPAWDDLEDEVARARASDAEQETTSR
ncbi:MULTISPECIES: cytochrome c [Halomonadaceae]|uniref:c-type cytochrome n=1 Tax=Halomonadaceae TaxID=28256 RepID=UPI0015982783|nr:MULTISPECIES: cytochrome c [Halomonas]QJQ94516.1 cytochrome c [Halomonas sp. PA5]